MKPVMKVMPRAVAPRNMVPIKRRSALIGTDVALARRGAARHSVCTASGADWHLASESQWILQ
jgi:hypothetical protein